MMTRFLPSSELIDRLVLNGLTLTNPDHWKAGIVEYGNMGQKGKKFIKIEIRPLNDCTNIISSSVMMAIGDHDELFIFPNEKHAS